MAHQDTVSLHHEVQFGDEIGIAAVAVKHIVLGTTWLIDVPECLPGEVFHRAVVLFPLKADSYILIHDFSDIEYLKVDN